MRVGRYVAVVWALGSACGGAQQTNAESEGAPDGNRVVQGADSGAIDSAADTVGDDGVTADEPLADAAHAADAADAADAEDAADASRGDATASDADARCMVLSNLAPPVDEMTSTEPRPVPSGGPVIDGTYISTQVVNYGSADAGYDLKAFQETILISNGLLHVVRDAPGFLLPHVVASASYVVSANKMVLRYICAPGVPGTEASQTVSYTSAPVDGGDMALLLFDSQRPAEVVVFSRK